MKMKEDFAHDPQTYALIGAAMEVHRQLGHGFLEAVYKEALAIEFAERGIPFQQEVMLSVYYKGRLLNCKYQSDFLCFNEITLEAKAIADLAGTHRSQTINYLKATKKHRGLLINFGKASLQSNTSASFSGIRRASRRPQSLNIKTTNLRKSA